MAAPRGFADAGSLRPAASAAFGAGRQLTAVHRLPGGTKKGAYRVTSAGFWPSRRLQGTRYRGNPVIKQLYTMICVKAYIPRAVNYCRKAEGRAFSYR
jgi:hypothetical protein